MRSGTRGGSTWDPTGQLIGSTDPLGVETHFSWDAAGQLIAIDYADDTPGVSVHLRRSTDAGRR